MSIPAADSDPLNPINPTVNTQSGEIDPRDLPDLLDPSHALEVLSMDQAQEMSEFFSILADPNRLRILSVLAQQERCVQDLAVIMGMSESAVSHQLRTLRSSRLVRYHKQGRKVFYSLNDHHVQILYQVVAEHLQESET